jgi:hypothetical protein
MYKLRNQSRILTVNNIKEFELELSLIIYSDE